MPFYFTPDILDKFPDYREEFRPTKLIFGVLLIDDFTKTDPIGKIKIIKKESDNEDFKDNCNDIKDNCGIKNRSGYYFFRTSISNSNLIADKYFINVESDLYFNIKKENEEIILSELKKTKLKFFDKGPSAKEMSSKLSDVSELSKGDEVEFHNPDDETEKKKIIDINEKQKIISWIGELEHDFSADGSTIIVFRDPIKKISLIPKPAYPFPDTATLVRGRVSNINPEKPPTVIVEGMIETKTDERGEFVLYLKRVKPKDKITVKISKNGDEKKIELTIQKEKETISLGVISFP